MYAPSGHSFPEQEILRTIMTAVAKKDIGIFPSFSRSTFAEFMIEVSKHCRSNVSGRMRPAGEYARISSEIDRTSVILPVVM
ncbi:hypothetical protein GCM10011352_38800 [Marinobacterium zhoushanense]|uniref:Uncharacterized protein n=1 Tax=Marinobacterium zhoushanense TaxID=1679163 RepID=A0ABQ1KW24_9GAMM|nr:hypothetical protein GCM10011352_38800 [Marinobacterium zhoushanense]